jgi:hypothetical protein
MNFIAGQTQRGRANRRELVGRDQKNKTRGQDERARQKEKAEGQLKKAWQNMVEGRAIQMNKERNSRRRVGDISGKGMREKCRK